MKTQEKATHTPTPWTYTHQTASDYSHDIVGPGRGFIATLGKQVCND